MGYILDILIVVIFALCVVYGVKKGFFKSLMSLVTGVCAYLAAYAATPTLSLFLKERFILNSMGESLEKTFTSIARQNPADNIYDLERLSSDPQFVKLIEQFAPESGVAEQLSGQTGSAALIREAAYKVADPIASMLSDVIAFIILFAVAIVLLKVLTAVVGLVFRLPVLKTLDKTMGLVFGIASGIFFAVITCIVVSSLASTLISVSPGTFDKDIIENSVIIKIFSDSNIIGNISGALK